MKDKFRFKEFEVNHSRSSMKVGVDGVLAGAWSTAEGAEGLDAGCGCGLIALMLAQRNTEAHITAADIDEDSAEEAAENFDASPWSERMEAACRDITDESFLKENEGRYDFIVSNPPYFDAGVKEIKTSRERARHQGTLSPAKLIEAATRLLKEGGTLAMIMPYDTAINIAEHLDSLTPERLTAVADRPGKAPKRVLLEMRKGEGVKLKRTQLYIRNEEGEYSEAYRELTGAFYL